MSKTQLQIARGLSLGLEAITDTFAFLARRGAGKTYCAGVLAEEMLEVGAQIVVLDPVSKWWGLRLKANGKDRAFELPVLGGPHGDVPLAPSSGELVATLIVEEGISCVLDLADFDSDAEQRRFVTAFAKKLYRLKQRQNPPTPMHLFLEEAEEFLPQDQLRDQSHMIGAMKKLIKLGRNYGIGCTLVTQRSADVNKKGLSQVGTMVALQTTSPHDRKAIKEWAHGLGDADNLETRVQIVLPTLEVGQALFWSPGSGVSKKIKFRKKRTFDTSSTPKLSARKRQSLKPRKLRDDRLAELREAMQEVVEESKRNNPLLLRKRIKQLERELAEAQKATPKVEQVETVREVPVSVVTPQEIEDLSQHVAAIRAIVSSAEAAVRRVQQGKMPFGPASTPRNVTKKRTKPAAQPRRDPAVFPAIHEGIRIKKGARRMLAAVSTASSGTLTRTQIGVLAQMKPTGGTFQDYLSTLRRAGLVTTRGKTVTITEAGTTFLGDDRPSIPTTTDEMLALWSPKLKRGMREMLRILVAVYPNTMSRDELGTKAGYTVAGGTFQDYLSTLRRNNLVIVDGQEVRASEEMFP